MATDYTSKKLSLHVAEQFNESFSEPEPSSVGYVFIGNHIPYTNEASPDTIFESISSEKQVWDNIFAAKRITGSDTSLVIPIKIWSTDQLFYQFDDQIPILTSDVNFYTINSNNQVYKCLSNNNGTLSTYEPTGDYSINNGLIETSDGYIWKYMYGYDSSNKFKTDSYIPVPRTANSQGYYTSINSIVDGAIYSIAITNSGYNYNVATINAYAYGTGTNSIKLESLINVANNMLVYGLGVPSNTTVSSINVANVSITISKNTSSNGGGTSNTLIFYPNALIIGDGVGATANLIISSTNTISKIIMTNYGSGYSYANVVIYANTNSGSARAIMGPKYGHGYYPAKELSANSVMISVKFGDVDTTEGGLISANTTIRQYGFLRDPAKYGNTVSVNSLTANSFISQTYKVTVVTGSSYNLNEKVYQGNISSPSFVGYVNSQTSNIINLSKVRGSLTLGSALVGETSLISRSAIDIQYPDLQPYSGDILYANNIQYIQRTFGQTENFNFVLRF